MRDIRADLRERLEAAEMEAKALDEAADAAAGRVDAIKDMLAAEEARIAAVAPAAAANGNVGRATANAEAVIRLGGTPPVTPPTINLDAFLVKAVRRGVHDKDELRDSAIRAGYFMGSTSSPGRVVHAKLTNLVREGTLGKNDLLGGYVAMGGS